MRLKYGKFLDTKIEKDWDNWDSLPIGAHAYTNRRIRENNETMRFEYYYEDDNGHMYIVEEPTMAEAAYAMTVGFRGGKKIVGYRDRATYVTTTKELKQILENSAEKQKGE